MIYLEKHLTILVINKGNPQPVHSLCPECKKLHRLDCAYYSIYAD